MVRPDDWEGEYARRERTDELEQALDEAMSALRESQDLSRNMLERLRLIRDWERDHRDQVDTYVIRMALKGVFNDDEH